MKTKILRAQESYDVALVVGKKQKIILEEFYKVAFYLELLLLPLFLLSNLLTHSLTFHV